MGMAVSRLGGYMSKITINKMSYYYEDFYNPVYENINLVIKTEWKLGLIGRNGRVRTYSRKYRHTCRG